MTQALRSAGVDVTPPNMISLRDLITQRQQSGQRFHLNEVVAIVVPICTDLAQRHARGETVYVHASSIGAGLDGMPRLVAQLARHKPKNPADLVGLAPELASGPTTPRSSVFGIGAVVYEMLTLHPIGPGMKPPSQLIGNLPPIVDTILAKALVTDPSQRPDDLSAFAQAIHHFAPASVAPPPAVDETAFEVDLDLRTSMLPPTDGSLNLRSPSIPRNDPARISADDPFGSIVEAPRPSQPSTPGRPSQNEELAALKSRLEADPAPRWVVVKDKMDHGPFAAIELLQQIASNTFKPDDLLTDTHTNKRIAIKEHPEFSRFAHHAALKRDQVKEAKEVVALEKSEKTAGGAKLILGILAVAAVAGVVGFVVYRIRGKAAAEEALKRDLEAQTLAGEGSISVNGKVKPKWTGGGGGGGGGAGYGGKGYDDALKNTVSDYDAETLSTKECAAPVGGGIAASCGLNGSARASILVKNGRAVGVTVTTDPNQPGVNSCMAGAIQGLSWRSVSGATGCIRTFKAN